MTLGRLPKCLDLARSFHQHGWRVLVAEPYPRHLTGNSRSVAASLTVPAPAAGKAAYLAALSRIVRDHGVDLVLPVSEEAMHVAHLAPLLPPGTRLYAPPPERLLELHDKLRFARLAQRLGLRVPGTAALDDPAAAALTGAGYVVKPVYSCAGRGVSLHGAGEALPTRDHAALVQTLVQGRHRSSFSIAHQGRVQVSVVYQGTVMSGSVATAFERVDDPAITAWIDRFVTATGHSGLISFDFITDADGLPWAIECNPRATSGLHFVETADLAPAILAPFAAPLRLKARRKLQQLYPTLTETQASIVRPRAYVRNVRHLFTSRDVTWDRRDPWPLLAMPVTAFGIILRAIRAGESFGQVATTDIAWFEGD